MTNISILMYELRKHASTLFAVSVLLMVLPPVLLAGCATGGGGAAMAPAPSAPAGAPTAAKAPARQVQLPQETGVLHVDVADTLGNPLPARVVLHHDPLSPPLAYEAHQGTARLEPPAGEYMAHVFVYGGGIPTIIDVQNITINAGQETYLVSNMLEGAAGRMPVSAFDADGDLYLDIVELRHDTAVDDAAAFPGATAVPEDTRVLKQEEGWYKGDLHVHSNYGAGSESVGELVRRAEKAGLDFLAITDFNTLSAAFDPAFRSDSVVLIPAMTWGTEALGYALIYGPKTVPTTPGPAIVAQGECLRTQAQGGVFAVAHPLFSEAPWLWGVSYVNAIEVWNGRWRAHAPLQLNTLPEAVRVKENGQLVHSIAAAAATSGLTSEAAVKAGAQDMSLSANAQALLFYDYELARGLMACMVGGSNSTGPQQPLGKPLIYVQAENKSLPAILEGLRYGRTFLSRGEDGPQVLFRADVLNDRKIDVGVGGAVPLNLETMFEIVVTGAKGMKMQLVFNGRTLMSDVIDADPYVKPFVDTPAYSGAYRVQIVAPAASSERGYGPLEVHALTSPIYARDITRHLLERLPNVEPDQVWLDVPSQYVDDVQGLPQELGREILMQELQ